MSRLLLLLSLLFLVSPSQADAPKGYPFVSFDEAMRQASEESRPVFVYFGRYGCGYCEKTNKESFVDATVKQRYIQHYVLAYVDAESGKRLRLPSGERITERELGTRYRAFVTPVFSFLTSDGQSIHQLVGVQSIESLLAADQIVQKKLAER